MASIKFELDAEVREDMGKGASRRLRHSNQVPAIVYGAGEAPVSITLAHDKVATATSHEAFYSHILTLKVGKKAEKVILKDMQRDPARPRIVHMDFLRVRADQKLHMNIPLHFLGEDVPPPGVKDGGVISHLMSDVEVSCLPADLPEYLELDISNLGMNETLHLSNIKLPKGVELVAFAHGVENHDQAVVSIHMPRMIEEEAVEVATEAAAEDAAAAEVAGEQKAAADAPAADKKEKGDKK